MPHVQSVIGSMNGGTGNSATVTVTAVGTGNSGVGFIIFRDITAQGTISVSDNKGNTYTVSTGVVSAANGDRSAIFHLDNITGGPTVITASTTEVAANVTFMQVGFSEYSGVRFDTWSNPPNTQTSPGTGTDAITSGNITTSGSGNTIWGASIGNVSTITIAIGTGFTQRAQDAVNGDWAMTFEDKAQSAAGSIAATFTDTTNGAGVGIHYNTGVVSLTPLIFAAGSFNEISLPYRSRQDYRMLAATSKEDEHWPFTATPNPLKWQGVDPPPQFPERTWHRFQWQDDEFPFTATVTQGRFGWQLDPQFPLRPRPKTFQSTDEQWPFTASEPTAFGVYHEPSFPSRLRFRPVLSQDDEYLFTKVPTPGQFGWDNPEHFPLRVRFRPVLSSDEEWVFTAATPSAFGVYHEPQFPVRVRFRTFQSADENWPVIVTLTPKQFGWQLDPQIPIRGKFQPVQTPPDTFQQIAGTPTPSNIDFAYTTGEIVTRPLFHPGIYEFWQPDIPPASPAFQTMAASATKDRAKTGAWYLTIGLQGTGIFVFTAAPNPTIFMEELPFGSAHIVLTSGSTPVSVALAVSNDGVNFIQLGPAATNFPAMLNLTASPGLSYPGKMPYKYHAWIVTGGDVSTLLTITEVLSGWRG